MIDTHCHIDEEAYESDRAEVIRRQQAEGVEAIVVPGIDVGSITSVMDVCQANPHYCYPALGLHPEEVKADRRTQLQKVEEAIRAHRQQLVAIGEIGLDYYWDKTFMAEQQEVLRRQLRLAAELQLPVILHNRDATEDILHILKEEVSIAAIKGVFHCYNGSKETAMQILDMGFYLGIGGVITFKNCKLADTLTALQSSCSSLSDRVLLETDAPYMTPVPYRGQRNESRFMIYVAERLSNALGCPVETVIEKTNANARRLFGLK